MAHLFGRYFPSLAHFVETSKACPVILPVFIYHCNPPAFPLCADTFSFSSSPAVAYNSSELILFVNSSNNSGGTVVIAPHFPGHRPFKCTTKRTEFGWATVVVRVDMQPKRVTPSSSERPTDHPPQRQQSSPKL